MKKRTLSLALLACLWSLPAVGLEDPAMSRAPDAEAIVQTQLDTYNARDLDAFMSTY